MKKILSVSLIVIIAILGLCSHSYAQYTKLYDFDSINGRFPQGSLVADGNYLYGMATVGGADNVGTIFKIKKDGTAFAKLLDFTGANGSLPQGSLISDGTYLYGMTAIGGTHNEGTIFKIKQDGTGYTKLFDFVDTLGEYPYGSLISDGTYLYGTTTSGGANGTGNVFKIKTNGTAYADLYDFPGTPGGFNARGTLFSDGTYLYGTTLGGGINYAGTIFKIKTDGTGYARLYDFDSIHGSEPHGALISDGTYLYGTTFKGGINNTGVLFKIKPDGTGFSKFLDFDALPGTATGSNPPGDLVYDGTVLYSMTFIGGAFGKGTVFKIKPDGTSFSKLLDFIPAVSGSQPLGSLVYNGSALYGMTNVGGAHQYGVVFKYALPAAGIAENTVDNGFTVYPNPGNGKFNVALKDELAAANYQITVYNVLGERVYSVTKSNRQPVIELDLSAVLKGIYFVTADDGKTVHTEKIIIQ
ncbi:MAG: hypothetical protein JWP12_241 [Bacteroidetes bacterium]|nr:hypothetical protein [Bacteroidota bacterium]